MSSHTPHRFYTLKQDEQYHQYERQLFSLIVLYLLYRRSSAWFKSLDSCYLNPARIKLGGTIPPKLFGVFRNEYDLSCQQITIALNVLRSRKSAKINSWSTTASNVLRSRKRVLKSTPRVPYQPFPMMCYTSMPVLTQLRGWRRGFNDSATLWLHCSLFTTYTL